MNKWIITKSFNILDLYGNKFHKTIEFVSLTNLIIYYKLRIDNRTSLNKFLINAALYLLKKNAYLADSILKDQNNIESDIEFNKKLKLYHSNFLKNELIILKENPDLDYLKEILANKFNMDKVNMTLINKLSTDYTYHKMLKELNTISSHSDVPMDKHIIDRIKASSDIIDNLNLGIIYDVNYISNDILGKLYNDVELMIESDIILDKIVYNLDLVPNKILDVKEKLRPYIITQLYQNRENERLERSKTS